MLQSSIGSPIDEQETRPLLRPLSIEWVSRAWLVVIAGSLATVWCVLDSWNHDMSSQLFKLSEVKGLMVDKRSGMVLQATEPFKYTLTLAFLQFAFAGLVFCTLFAMKAAATGNGMKDNLAKNAQSISDWRWPSLMVTHVFSSVLLQSLMMPAQMMSLGLFAATRAVEVPTAAAVRASVFRTPFGGHAPHTVLAMFTAAWVLFFCYSQIAECLCIWSGFGVALTGLPLYFVYALVLTVPATNVVLQESVLVQLKACPLLMQGLPNAVAALAFVPVLFVAHWLGYEDVLRAITMISGHREVYMTILWLCVQTTGISAVTVCLILTVDSFWTIAARSLRVIFWWLRQLQFFYLSSGTLLSVARPNASMWSLGMVAGIFLASTALLTDVPSQKEDAAIDGAKGMGNGKWV